MKFESLQIKTSTFKRLLLKNLCIFALGKVYIQLLVIGCFFYNQQFFLLKKGLFLAVFFYQRKDYLMKKCLLFLLFLELFATAISQEKSVYIWDNGKRVSLLEDTTSFVFYSKDNRVLDNSISRYVQKTLRTKHSESYHIVKKTNTLFFNK